MTFPKGVALINFHRPQKSPFGMSIEPTNLGTKSLTCCFWATKKATKHTKLYQIMLLRKMYPHQLLFPPPLQCFQYRLIYTPGTNVVSFCGRMVFPRPKLMGSGQWCPQRLKDYANHLGWQVQWRQGSWKETTQFLPNVTSDNVQLDVGFFS